MKKSERNAILLSFYQSKSSYEKLSREIRRLFETDPSFPTESLYTIKYRIKDADRVIDKIDMRNRKRAKRVSPVDVTNYRERIEDLLGVRIVCLRLADVEKVEIYLNSLKEEGKLVFGRRPRKKQTFILPVNPSEGVPKGVDLQYSGYSSIHYVVKLGKALNPSEEIASLRAEIQLRTILEEAWGEIDHKYRYEIVRKGATVPNHIQRGFYNLSAYLQAAALQAEYLCRGVEEIKMPKKRASKKLIRAAAEPRAPRIPSKTEDVLKAKFGFTPALRTVAYIKRRMSDANIYEDIAQILYERILTEETMTAFKAIYKNIMQKEPFTDEAVRDIDLLNAVNYALFRLIQPEAVAKEGLEWILGGRLE